MPIASQQTPQGQTLFITGALVLAEARAWENAFAALPIDPKTALTLDLSGVERADSCGLLLLHQNQQCWEKAGVTVTLCNLPPSLVPLFDTLTALLPPKPVPRSSAPGLLDYLSETGQFTLLLLDRSGAMLAFLGAVLLRLGKAIARPHTLRWTAFFYHLEHIGLRALGIIGLMSFLIGLALVQQGAFQLKRFGAEIFVVDLVSISTLRELGVLLASIMIAGRSGSAFTAQIGAMKLTEEVDALRVIGINPIDALVLPRLLALVLVSPLLVFYANMMVLMGGMVFGWLSLDIPIATFLSRLRETATMNDLLVGLIKAPVFGLVIALSGCFEGMRVSGDAASVGQHTTASVVQAIFMVIVLDAFFAIFFSFIDM